MRGKVTADAYSGGRRIGGEMNWWKVIRGGVVRVDGFAMRDDDWEVTRPRVTTAREG